MTFFHNLFLLFHLQIFDKEPLYPLKRDNIRPVIQICMDSQKQNLPLLLFLPFVELPFPLNRLSRFIILFSCRVSCNDYLAFCPGIIHYQLYHLRSCYPPGQRIFDTVNFCDDSRIDLGFLKCQICSYHLAVYQL